ncbi:MAG: DUF2752 domain-containing protein [Clostridium sp.]
MNILAEVLRVVGQGGYPCLFHIITGAYCPGCGGTRAAILLLHGDIIKSTCYHPLVPYLALVLPILLLCWFYDRRKKKMMFQKLWKPILYAGILIIAANFVIKNYFLLVRHVDILSILDRLMGV